MKAIGIAIFIVIGCIFVAAIALPPLLWALRRLGSLGVALVEIGFIGIGCVLDWGCGWWDYWLEN